MGSERVERARAHGARTYLRAEEPGRCPFANCAELRPCLHDLASFAAEEVARALEEAAGVLGPESDWLRARAAKERG
jgi:hypothetical protein